MRPQLDLFHRQWCFVEQVDMTRESVLLRFNLDSPSGPFNAQAEVVETFSGMHYTSQIDDFAVPTTLRLPLNFQHPQDYAVKFFLDDHLAYSGRYQEDPLPF